MEESPPINVLLIEDNPTDVLLVKELLRDAPNGQFTIVTASTLAQGLEHLASGHVDVILLDLGLPDSQGFDSFHSVATRAPDLPIIILTVSTDEELGRKIVLEGAQQFFSKDVLTPDGAYAEMFPRMICFAIERKRVEAALVKSEQHYRDLINNLDAIVVRVDPQLRITFANDYALTLLGYTAEEFVGRHLMGTLLPATESTGRDLEEMAHDVLTHPERYEHNRNEVLTKGGRRLWIEWTNTPQYDEGNYVGVLSTGIDITERIVAEEALHDARKELEGLNTELQSINTLLQIANAELERRVQERTEELVLEHTVNAALARLTEPLLSSSSDPEALSLAILAEAKQLTHSAHGFVAVIDPLTKDIISYGHTRMMLDECAVPEAQRPIRFPLGPDGKYHALSTYAINERKGFFTNAPAEHPASTGAPKGHVKLEQFLAVPTLVGGESVGEIALANPGRAYTQRDVDVVGRLAEIFALTVMRMRAEASTKEQAELINLAGDAIVVRDLDHRVTFWNKGAEALFGWTAAEAYGKRVPTLLHAVYPTSFEAGHAELLKTRSWHAEATVTTKAGEERVIELTWTLKRDDKDNPTAILSIAHDITERRHAEAELQRYSDHLEAIVEERTARLKDTERLAGIGQTAAMIGHDLRNPLQGLQYIVDLQKLRFERMTSADRSTEEWQKEEALFDRISEQIFYMDKIVGDLQDYARPIAVEHEVVGLGALFNDVLDSLPYSDGVQVVVDVNHLTITADPHLIRRAFSNLILNALQAMPDGGTLTINATAEDGSIGINIRDTGVGIPPDMREKVFSPLTTGKAKGTGLGLAVVKRIVEAHNGTITLTSEEGKGTTFIVTLPQTAE